jgi:hypothetical protein
MNAHPAALVRVESWPEALGAFVRSRAAVPFAWGAHDCCLFAADAIAAITGVDLAESLRGYGSALGACRRARAAAGAPVPFYGVETWPAHVGLEEMPLLHARRGDVLLCEFRTARRAGRALGICLGHTCACAGPAGLTFLSPAHWRRAWRVG